MMRRSMNTQAAVPGERPGTGACWNAHQDSAAADLMIELGEKQIGAQEK
jgi:hypothetical protein